MVLRPPSGNAGSEIVTLRGGEGAFGSFQAIDLNAADTLRARSDGLERRTPMSISVPSAPTSTRQGKAVRLRPTVFLDYDELGDTMATVEIPAGTPPELVRSRSEKGIATLEGNCPFRRARFASVLQFGMDSSPLHADREGNPRTRERATIVASLQWKGVMGTAEPSLLAKKFEDSEILIGSGPDAIEKKASFLTRVEISISEWLWENIFQRWAIFSQTTSTDYMLFR